jgi:hypothetical protein
MAKMQDLLVVIGLDGKSLNKLNKDLRGVKARFRNNLSEIQAMTQNVGRNLTMGLTAPLGIMAVQSVKAFDAQAKAIAQVEQGLKSTSGQVGFTSAELQKMASDLQTKTLFGDEVILKDATAQLLTFTNIAGDNFARTQKVALDLATRLDGDLKSASIQLGKALNDPVANLSALSRSGIQFSADQKEVIKSLAETGQLAEAQGVILEELERQYGGSAEAAALAGTGPFTQLGNTIGDISEEFGRLINEFIAPLVPKIQGLAHSFRSLTDRQKQVMLVVGAIAAAAGPILLTVSALIKMRIAMASLNIVMAANPIGAVAVAVTLLIGSLEALKSMTKTTREETDTFIESTKELEKQQALLALNTKRRALETELASKRQAQAVEEARASVAAAGDKFDKQIARRSVTKFDKQIQDLEASIIALKKEAAELEFGGIVVGGDDGDGGASVTDAAIQTETVRNVERLQQAHARTAQTVKNHALENRGLRGSYDQLQQSLEPVIGRFRELGMFVKDQLPNFFMNAFEALRQGTKSFGEFMLQTLERLLIKAAALVATFAVLSILMGGATGVAELTGGKAGLKFFLGAGMGIPQMAEGGLFSGASLAMVGEGPGTSSINPEVVAPLDKLRNMMGGGNVNVTGTIRGRDLLLSEERSAYSRRRRFGN